MNNYVVVLGSNLSSEFGNSAETLKKCVDEIRSNPRYRVSIREQLVYFFELSE